MCDGAKILDWRPPDASYSALPAKRSFTAATNTHSGLLRTKGFLIASGKRMVQNAANAWFVCCCFLSREVKAIVQPGANAFRRVVLLG